MTNRKKSRLWLVTNAVLLAAILLSPVLGRVIQSQPSTAEAASLNTIIYMPLVMKNFPVQTVFGAGLEHINSSWGLEQMVAANISWMRLPGVLWSDVEPTQGMYDWSVLSGVETELKNASSKGLQVILLVHGTPEWARKIPGAGPTCGPIAANKLSAFGDFMHALVARYSAAPYNVKNWELWNEEDVDPSLVPADSGYGCWGDQNDEYYGGGYYAEMLKVAYPKIKAADPKSKVLVGGLLLDCDPRGGCAAVGKSNLAAKFMEGVLRNNGGAYFDGVSYHAYDYYLGIQGEYFNPNWASAWNTTGPVGITKAQYIQGLVSQYGVSGKFLMNTETALICGSSGAEPPCQTNDFSNTKVYYVAQSYAAAIAEGLRANIWYSALGWRGSGLINRGLRPQPAYTAFKFSRSELGEATYSGEITAADIEGASGIKGYKFQNGNRRVWVLWSLDGAEHMIPFSSAPAAGWDALGNPVPTATSMNVTLNPFYLEWTP